MRNAKRDKNLREFIKYLLIDKHLYLITLILLRNKCIKCEIQFGEYHCNICNLWMALDKKPFHCDHCGFCRVGGREGFRHCVDCSMVRPFLEK